MSKKTGRKGGGADKRLLLRKRIKDRENAQNKKRRNSISQKSRYPAFHFHLQIFDVFTETSETHISFYVSPKRLKRFTGKRR